MQQQKVFSDVLSTKMAIQAGVTTSYSSKAGVHPHVRRYIALPAEILSRIFSFVSDKTTLQNLTLSCRQFHQLIVPLLFRDIYAHCGTLTLATPPKLTKRNPLRELSLHLLRERSFAADVRHVKLYGPSFEYYAHVEAADDQVDVQLQAAVKKYLQNPKNVSSRLARVGVNWLSFTYHDRITNLVLLLGLLPNIRSLHIHMAAVHLLADNILSLNVFKDLDELVLEWAPGNMHVERRTLFDETHLKEMISIKSLRKACVVRLSSEPLFPTNTSSFETFEPRSCSVANLEIRASKLYRRDPAPLLAAFCALKSFVYEQSWNPLLGLRYAKPSTFLSALKRHHYDSLESLWLDYSKDSPVKHSGFQRDFFPQSALRSLSELRCLRHVCLPIEMMFESEPAGMWYGAPWCFPKSLETLVLISHTNSWNPPLATFAEDFFQFLQIARTRADSDANRLREVLPNLRTVVFIAQGDQFLHCPPTLFPQIDSIPNLEVVFGQSGYHWIQGTLEDPVSRRIQEIEDLMGLTRLYGKRWKGIDNTALRRSCMYYESLRWRYGYFGHSGEKHTPEVLRKMSRND